MPPDAPSQDAIDLGRALARLEAKILTSPPPRLLCSAPERSKTRANLEYARTLLLRLEHGAAQTKVAARRHAAQGVLARQRALVKRLTERLHDLEAADDGTGVWHGGSEASSDEDIAEDILAAVAAPAITVAAVPDSNSPDSAIPTTTTTAAAPSATPSAPRPTLHSATSSTTSSAAPSASTLRARAARLGTDAETTRGSTTAHSLRPESASTFSSPTKAPSKETATATALQTASSVQAELTGAMVEMAGALKESARAFAGALEADTAALGRAGEGLERSRGGLDAAARGLGVLHRMSEGRWWWARWLLSAGIVALWGVLLLLVFVGPKLRW